MERPAARQREDTAPLRPLRALTLPRWLLRGPRHRRGLPERRASCPLLQIAPGAGHAPARGRRRAERLAVPRARRAVLEDARCKEYNSYFLPTPHLSSPRPRTMSWRARARTCSLPTRRGGRRGEVRWREIAMLTFIPEPRGEGAWPSSVEPGPDDRKGEGRACGKP